MNKRFSFSGRFTTIIAVMWVLIVTSCNKNFDEPPINIDPDIPVNMTIKELKAMYAGAGMFQKITQDKTISGVVVADDKSGNFYKQIIIQDSTGGIPIQMDGTEMYTSYPVGRKVFVKLKGLMLGDYGGNIQLGLDSVRSGSFLNLGRIPDALFDTYIVKGSYGNVITPKIVKPSDFNGAITDPLLSTLVQINNMEFKDADLPKTYADAVNKATVSAVNFTLKPCNDTKSIVLRNSSYATFAALQVPQGNGPMVGVPSVFNGTLQIFIRDTSDVQFKGTRCSGQIVSTTTKSIADVLKYATGDSTIPAGTWIEGTLVSATTNEAAGNYRLQDGTAGLQLRFASGSYPSGALGDKLKVYVGGFKLSLFNNGLQVNGVDVSANTGTATVTPRVATVKQLVDSARVWESTVVTVNNVTISGSSPNYTITDATGSVTSYVRTTSGITMPTAAASITGYVSLYPTAQLTLRTQADIVGGTNAPPGSGPFTATFDFAGLLTTSGTTDPTAVPTVSNLTFTNFKAVNVGTASSAGGRFSFPGWPTGATNASDAFTGSIDLTKYYEVTITPASGSKLDITKLTFTFQRSGTGVRQAVVRASVDNFGTNLPATIDPANANLSIVSTNIFQVTDAATSANDGSTITFGAAYTNLTVPVTIRFYGFNAEATTGTFSIDNVVITGTTK